MRVFITGAASGMGQAFAKAYAKQGAQLGLLDLHLDALSALNKSLGGGHLCYAVDVRDHEAVLKAGSDFSSKGQVDLVLACAGISRGTLLDYPEDYEVFERILDINVLGLVSTFQAFVPTMKDQGFGTLVGIASVSGVRGIPGSSAYSSSKAAVRLACESFRVDLKPMGIDVVTIAPGYIKTPLTACNPYKMPFLMEVDDFVEVATRKIQKKTPYTTIPWQMGWMGRLLHRLPCSVYDYFLSKKRKKPRDTEVLK